MLLCVFILLGFVTSPAVTREARNGVSSCRDDQLQCSDGSCIPLDGVCEVPDSASAFIDPAIRKLSQMLPPRATVTTTDKATLETESRISELNPSQPKNQSQSTYIRKQSPQKHMTQNDFSPELLQPVYQDYGVPVPASDYAPGSGSYSSQGGSSFSQGGYSFSQGGSSFSQGSGSSFSQGSSSHSSQGSGSSSAYCKLPRHPSVDYSCYDPGSQRFKPCKYYVAPGMEVSPFCNRPSYGSSKLFDYMRCYYGSWNYVARCKADCGRITPIQLIGGTQAKRGELPWHAGIYLKTTLPYMQVCGGSLIANNIVVSAAHCFWKGKKQPASDYAVAVGKIYSSWNNQADVDAQKSDVKEIKIPDLFQGSEANYQEDIAVLILVTPFVFNKFVRPVCLNFDDNLNERQLQPGNLGIVAGWGLATSNGKASEVLKVVNMPYINETTCTTKGPSSSREYITDDKFCAGYTNGTAICIGDSGGGLAFPALTEKKVKRYYLRGVVSTAPTQDGKLCNDNTYTTFTKISKHANFIKRSVAASLIKICPPWQFQCSDGTCSTGDECNGKPDCKDGSDEFVELCGVQEQNTTGYNRTDLKLETPLPKYERQNTYSFDPTQRKLMSPFAHKGEPVPYSVGLSPPKDEYAYSPEPSPPKYESQNTHSSEPTQPELFSQFAHKGEPVPYSVGLSPPKDKYAYSPEPSPPKYESQNTHSSEPTQPELFSQFAHKGEPVPYNVVLSPLQDKYAYSPEPSPPKYESQNTNSSEPTQPELFSQFAHKGEPVPYNVVLSPLQDKYAYSPEPSPPKYESQNTNSSEPTQPELFSQFAHEGEPVPYNVVLSPLKDKYAYSPEPSPPKDQSQNAYSQEQSLPEHMTQNDYSPELLQPVYANHGIGQPSSGHGSIQSERPGNATYCVVPPYPLYGTHEVKNVANATAGQSFTSFELIYRCNLGYGIINENGQHQPTQEVYCINGRWLQSIPLCIPFCRLAPDPSVHYMCEVPGTHWFKPCEYYVVPGTNVNPVCNSPIYFSSEPLLYMKCTYGIWNYIAKCKADCGRVTPEGTPQVIGGTQAKRGELPWHAGIYLKTTSPYMQVCGGSLIANNAVVSAAHCFWSGKKLLASDYAVAVGKIYRPWNNQVDVDAQKSDVKEIKIPELFQGSDANFQEDIAVLILVTPFIYKTYVRPVCLNFDFNFDRRQLQVGNFGIVAGWGLTAANGKASQVLKVVDMPFINVGTCIKTVPPSFREYITSDKFCAGYTNGTAMCKGDSGGGLAFPAFTELNIERYYLRGVVSTAPTQDEKLCNDNTYTTFTKISKHVDFIKNSVVASITKVCPPWQFQCSDGTCLRATSECNQIPDCKDGSDEFIELCGVQEQIPGRDEDPPSRISNLALLGSRKPVEVHVSSEQCSFDCIKEEMSSKNETKKQSAALIENRVAPWHVSIYRKIDKPYSRICSGSLITRNLVISGADPFDRERQNFPSLFVRDFAVAAGKLYQAWDDERDVDVQRSDVKSIKIPLVGTGGEELAFVFLVDRLVYTAAVKPVAVANSNEKEKDLHSGELLELAGWSQETGVLEVLRMPFITNRVCLKTLPVISQYVSESHICTGYNGSPIRPSDFSGGGLVVPMHDSDTTRYILVGVLVASQNCNDEFINCAYNSDSYFIFSDVSIWFDFLHDQSYSVYVSNAY